jgi:hypothetical protein
MSKCQTVGETVFFTWHIVLGASKIWQPLGDALTKVQKGKFIWLHVLNKAMSPRAQSNSHKTKYDVCARMNCEAQAVL